MRRIDSRLQTITETLRKPLPEVASADLITGQHVSRFDPSVNAGEAPAPWSMQVDMLARRIFTALYGRPQTGEQQSPLERAEDAKRARDLGAEIAALQQGHTDLTSAPWYPVRPGDLVHVHYEAGGMLDAFGETYRIAAGSDGFLSMQLLCHTLPDTEDPEGMVGCYAVDDDPDPLMELWFEAGPHRLTIVRDGQVVHDGGRRGRGTAAARVLFEAERHAATMREVQRYLERGEPELALARLTSGKPLPPCRAPGIMPEQPDCPRPRGHRPPCSDDPDYVTPPHECPALPEQLYAVVSVDAKVEGVHFAGLCGDRDTAVDHASGFDSYREDLTERYVKPLPGVPGEMVLTLPQENQHRVVGTQLVAVVPLQVLPDLRAEEERAAEGMATALDPEDYADDYRDVDE